MIRTPSGKLRAPRLWKKESTSRLTLWGRDTDTDTSAVTTSVGGARNGTTGVLSAADASVAASRTGGVIVMVTVTVSVSPAGSVST